MDKRKQFGELPGLEDRLIKFLDANRWSCHGGKGQWTVGKWRTVAGMLVPCMNGIHLCRPRDMLDWLDTTAWEAQADLRGAIATDNKVVVRRARIIKQLACNAQTLRLFAADCAERALAKARVRDVWCRKVVRAARRFAFGLINAQERNAAMVFAASPLRSSFVWDCAAAARDAAKATVGPDARTTTQTAAWAAIRATNGAKAIAAEARWQTKRLLAYFDEQVNLDQIKERL